MNNPSDQYMVCIDGSFGEGGGQILRTSLALSCLLGKPIELRNIRKSRKNPGLQPQHLTAVAAAASIANAAVRGADLSSTFLQFRPNKIRGGTYDFNVAKKKASAGSVSLVLQTILLPLCFAEQPSVVAVKGGTHVPWSPSFHYLNYIVTPLLLHLGVVAEYSIASWGWYPLGNGQVSAHIKPAQTLRHLTLIDRGKLLSITGISAVSNLPNHIAARQRDRAIAVLSKQGVKASIETVSAPSNGKGSFLFLAAEFEHLSAGFESLGAIGKRAEEVADEACNGLLSYLHARGALDPHLADQVVPWLAFCQGASEFTTSCVTQHLLTNIWVMQQFMDVDVQIEGCEGEAGRILIRPPTRFNYVIKKN
jgi:RNA 3'-terminal phosphate cyclase (ATP)